MIERFGSGKGCDICKPAVASILASTSSGHILDGEQASLQDSNDHFLANIQRNGSYSIVPRVPGGDITPEQLILIGEIARDFNLYTKITGGQRIDMFGARVDQLPEIWRRLVDGGMESGHAYGKALRTVKSCVGSDWCRYGQQDSVQMAINLELRYRGLRAPHKIKMGVSGCARECAEARSKDVGVIATENGWNLYIGGNGGMTPKHAQLLAGDLDDETLVRYIDRFLMFYIRTADRLQRTAPWVEQLDGGLEHLRDVVCDDSLGLAAEFEEAIARHVEGYACEWKGVLEDPDKLSRFVSFVNAPDVVDPTIEFTERSGRINLGLEGTLVMGAMAGYGVSYLTGSPWLGVLAAGIAGAGMGALHAGICGLPRVNDIAVGIALMLFGVGLAFYLGKPLIEPTAPRLPSIDFGWWSDIPQVRAALRINVLFLFGVALAPILVWALRTTRWGLIIRTAGESADAALAMGYSVNMIRLRATMFGGFLAGIGGSFLSLFYPGSWNEGLSSGQGITAVALVIFARWNPMLCLWASLLFGGAAALGPALQSIGFSYGYHLFNAAPYILTLLIMIATCSPKRTLIGAPAELSITR